MIFFLLWLTKKKHQKNTQTNITNIQQKKQFLNLPTKKPTKNPRNNHLAILCDLFGIVKVTPF